MEVSFMPTRLLDLEPKRRDSILNAALKEFAMKGFDNASTNIIAREAGISKALMFHYVNSKQELFLLVYDYFTELLNKRYYTKMNLAEKDIFVRLQQSYILQIELIKQYPWIFELNRISVPTNSEEVNNALKERVDEKQLLCYNQIFDMIDESKFRNSLDIAMSKQFIFWANVGFTNEMLDDIRNLKSSALDYELLVKKIDGYLEELRKIFYTPHKEEI
jgi:AcrR family transcriptional regulator